jgi:ApaG protein
MTKKKRDITVSARTSFMMSESDVDSQKFVWSYEITIVNHTDEIVQLLNRFWRITDMTGRIEDITGIGVVGLQPVIKPGKEFSYKSYCQINTPQGTMEGHFEMQNMEDQHFEVEIPKFILSAPSRMTKAFRDKLH